MATVTVSTSATSTFVGSQAVRRAVSVTIKKLEGTRIEDLKVYTNLKGGWKNADPEKDYAGVVPVIGGKERFDLALLTAELMRTDVDGYEADEKGKVSKRITVDLTTNPLYKFSNDLLDNNADITYDEWLSKIAAEFKTATINAIKVVKKNRFDGTWTCYELGYTK
jgi:hypothetical protein